MPPSLALLLRDYGSEVETQRLLLGKSLTDNDFVFAHPDGTPLDPSSIMCLSKWFAKRVKVEVARLAAQLCLHHAGGGDKCEGNQ